MQRLRTRKVKKSLDKGVKVWYDVNSQGNHNRKEHKMYWFIGVRRIGAEVFMRSVLPTDGTHGHIYDDIKGPYDSRKAAFKALERIV